MAESFDPYHLWLGISPGNQPPNHYRLLGIELFESSDDVIDAAASRQSMTLRDFTSGEHGDLAEKLLDEVRAARVCLLNAKEKTAYDASLRDQLLQKGENLPEITARVGSEDPGPGCYLWLGIAPEHQPPDHYRLLGLDPFESSQEVIQAGADRQSRYLREVAVGRQRRQSQNLLNEVAAARRCLLDPEKKQAYDEKLRAAASVDQSGQQSDAAQAASADVPSSEVGDSGESIESKQDSSRADQSSPERPTAQQSESELPASTGSSSFPDPATINLELESQPSSTASDSGEDSPRKTWIIVGSVAAIVLFVGTGVFLWLPGSQASASRESDSDNSQATADLESSVGSRAEHETASGQQVAASGQLAHWTFDEMNPDWAANEIGPLVLAMRGSPKFESGPRGQAVRLDGDDDVLELPHGVLARDNGTIAFWVRRDGEDGGTLLSSQSKPMHLSLSLSARGVVTGKIGTEPKRLETKSQLEPGKWYHLALVWQPDGKAGLFCNAEQVSHVEEAGPFGLPEKLTMGLSSEGKTLQVSLDDVQCFNRALQLDELKELVKAASVELTPPKVYSGEPDGQLVAAAVKTPTVPVNPKPKTAGNAKKSTGNKKKTATKPAQPAPTPPPARKVLLPEGDATISSQFWKNTGNLQFSDLADSFPRSRPSYRRLKSLAAGSKERLGAKAFQRVRGILVPPVDGDYRFHLRFVDEGKFLLSTDLSPSTKRNEIKDGQAVRLSGTQLYYFELLHLDKEGKGSFSVGWTLPNGSREQPVPASRLRWTPWLTSFASLPISQIESSESLTVQKVENSDLILASGDSRTESTVTLESQSDVTTYSAFLLEAIADEELLSNGPGLGPRGMFSLTDLTLEFQEPGSTTFVAVPLEAPIAMHGAPAGLVDGNASTKWTVRERDLESTSVILVPEKRLEFPPQTKLRLTIRQETPLGLFRIRGTAGSATSRVNEMKRKIEAANAPYSLFVNLGPGNWTDPENRVWTKSKPYANGSWGHQGGQVVASPAGESAPGFLKSAVSGITAFRADVPNGKYEVTLFFGAQGVKKFGDRAFSVQLESLAPVPIDLFKVTGGGNRPFAPTTSVVVKDGRLDIVFRKIAGSAPILNAVSITE